MPLAISLIVARHPLPLDILKTTRRIAGQCQTPNAGISQRDFALQNLVAAGTLLPHIEWPKGLALDWRQNGHRALQMVLFALNEYCYLGNNRKFPPYKASGGQ